MINTVVVLKNGKVLKVPFVERAFNELQIQIKEGTNEEWTLGSIVTTTSRIVSVTPLDKELEEIVLDEKKIVMDYPKLSRELSFNGSVVFDTFHDMFTESLHVDKGEMESILKFLMEWNKEREVINND